MRPADHPHPAADLPFWQKELFGSTEWWASWNRRNRVEGLFGNLKKDAAQNITRGRIRVMGLAKVSLMSLFVAIAANLRLADTFAAAQAKKAADEAANAAGVIKQTRKPRFRTQLTTEMRDRMATRQATRTAHDTAADAGRTRPTTNRVAAHRGPTSAYSTSPGITEGTGLPANRAPGHQACPTHGS